MKQLLLKHGLNVLLLFVPAALACFFLHLDETWAFATSALALIPLAGKMGDATEKISDHAGPALGGLLNATFGNAAELILAIVGLMAGQDVLVKASLTGSIIGNLLLVLGAAAFAGGIGREKQTFPATAASTSASMLLVSVTALLAPAVLHQTHGVSAEAYGPLSGGTSIVLLVSYIGGLIFSLKTHSHLYDLADVAHDDADPEGAAEPLWKPIVTLVVVTVGVATMAEILVHTVEHAVSRFGLSPTFVGVVVVAVVGNAAEHSTAVWMALKDRMDIAVAISVESSKQVALFVAPCVVLASVPLRGTWLTLEFSAPEIIALLMCTIILNFVTHDGETNWLEGFQLLALYAVLAIMFYFVP